jgi:transcriptional regulator with GAF, ATPase, and Fis domain
MNISQNSARDMMIYELGNLFTARLGLEELIPLIISKCRELLDAGGVSILLLDEERDELSFPYVSEDDPAAAGRLSGLRIPASSGLAGAALRSGRAKMVDDPQSDPRFYSGVDRKTGITTKSLLVAPLLTGDERLGVIEAVNPRGRPSFTDADLALLEKLALSIAVAVQNARRFREVKASAEQLQARVGVLRRDLARRDRFTEIIGVNAAMLELASASNHKSLRGFDPSVVDLLSPADWPRNVRELQNEMDRMVALATDGETITADHLSPTLRPTEVSGDAATSIRLASSPAGEDHAFAFPTRLLRSATCTRRLHCGTRERPRRRGTFRRSWPNTGTMYRIQRWHSESPALLFRRK